MTILKQKNYFINVYDIRKSVLLVFQYQTMSQGRFSKSRMETEGAQRYPKTLHFKDGPCFSPNDFLCSLLFHMVYNLLQKNHSNNSAELFVCFNFQRPMIRKLQSPSPGMGQKTVSKLFQSLLPSGYSLKRNRRHCHSYI